MALDREIRAELVRDPGINERGDPIPRTVARPASILRASAARIQDALAGTVSLEAVVLCAEAAATNGEWDDAAELAHRFFVRSPAQDQWYIRALLVQASIEANVVGDERGAQAGKSRPGSDPTALTAPLCGLPAARQRQKALAYVVEALELALKPENRPHYDFLVYNASVRHWKIVRGFLKDGSRELAVPSLEKVVTALETTDDPDVRWRSRNCLALAQAFDDAGQADKAAAYMTKALQLAGKVAHDNAPQVSEETRRAAVHVARSGGAAAKLTDAARSEAKSGEHAVPGASASRGLHYVELQALLSNAAPGDVLPQLLSILKVEDPITHGGYEETAAAAEGREVEVPEPTAEQRDKVVDYEIVAVIGRVAAARKQYVVDGGCVSVSVPVADTAMLLPWLAPASSLHRYALMQLHVPRRLAAPRV